MLWVDEYPGTGGNRGDEGIGTFVSLLDVLEIEHRIRAHRKPGGHSLVEVDPYGVSLESG